MRGITRLAAAAALTLAGLAAPAFGQTKPPTTKAHVSAANAASIAAPARLRAAAGRYDGAWSIVIETMRGDCPAALRAGVHILAGRLAADDGSYRLAGRVAASGAVRVSVSAAGHSADGSGRLGRDVGRGRWRSSSDQCAGQWTARRHG